MIESKAKEELDQIAEDIHFGRIFCDRHCRSLDDVRLVFMTIALLDIEQLHQLRDDKPGMIYEYLDEAGPMSCNGYPQFLSMKLLNIDDTNYVLERIEKIKTAMAGIN